jgi:hypothetical protein
MNGTPMNVITKPAPILIPVSLKKLFSSPVSLKKLFVSPIARKMVLFFIMLGCASYIYISSTTVDDETHNEKTGDTKKGMVISGIILGVVIIVGIGYSLHKNKTLTTGALHTAPINPDMMCYIWFGLIYVGIWFTIISIIIKVSNIITTDPISVCATTPNYTKQYSKANSDITDKTFLQGLAPIFDFRYNRIDSIKFSYASKNKVKMFPPQKNPPTKPTTTNDYNNVIDNIQSIIVTYWNIINPSIKRTCTISDRYTKCLILGIISQVPAKTPDEKKDEYPYTCSNSSPGTSKI